jgi:outer membrane lipoprotein-sorting protein
MQRRVRVAVVALLGLLWLVPAGFPQSSKPPLERVLDSMDKAAADFTTIEADFVWNQYQRVVDETDTQKGKIYFRKTAKGVEMMADVEKSDSGGRKSILFSDSKVQIYEPGPDNKTDQVTVYNTTNHAEIETYLLLGFGGRGHDLSKSFDVSYAASEKVDGIDTDKIKLVPKSEKVRSNFDQIFLWIDPARGISIQQQLFPPKTGDYRLSKYSNFHLHQKIPDGVFRLKTTGKTKFITP